MTCLRMSLGVTVLALAGLAIGSLVTADDVKKAPPVAQPRPEADENSAKSKPIDQDLRHFMRVKLDASGKILEGLAVEDFALIKEGAVKLSQMSTAEKWRVTNDALYRNHSSEFARITKELADAANDENLDRAALKWMDATMSCIECHRYARGIFIASADSSNAEQP